MWKRLSEWARRMLGASRRKADRAALQAHISQLEQACEAVRYTPLPSIGGTAHVVEVVHQQVRYKAVGRTRLEAYRKMIDHLASEVPE